MPIPKLNSKQGLWRPRKHCWNVSTTTKKLKIKAKKTCHDVTPLPVASIYCGSEGNSNILRRVPSQETSLTIMPSSFPWSWSDMKKAYIHVHIKIKQTVKKLYDTGVARWREGMCSLGSWLWRFECYQQTWYYQNRVQLANSKY